MTDKRNKHIEEDVMSDDMIRSIAESAITEAELKDVKDVDEYEDEYELEEASSDFSKWSDAKLKTWLDKNDTDEPGISPVFGQQLKRARMELAKRKKKMKKEDFDLERDLSALTLNESGLSEDFKEKAQVIFEAAINNRVDKIGIDLAHQYLDEKAQLEEQFEEDLQEQVELAVSTVVESVNSYLSYAISEWTSENQLAIESGIRHDITENFISGLKTLFTENYIEVPEEKVDLVDEMSQQIENLKENMNKTEKENIRLFEQLNEVRRLQTIEEAAEDLTLSQKERFKTLCEGIGFQNEQQFKRKINILKSTYFDKSDSLNGQGLHGLHEDYDEFGTLGDNVDVSRDVERRPKSQMDVYASVISRHIGSNPSSSLF